MDPSQTCIIPRETVRSHGLLAYFKQSKKKNHKCIFVYDKVQVPVNLFLCFLVNVKWGKEKFSDVECNTEEPPMVFKAQLFALSGVQPDRQKIMVKGAVVKVALVTVFL